MHPRSSASTNSIERETEAARVGESRGGLMITLEKAWQICRCLELDRTPGVTPRGAFG
jgi:hypothetical protein